MHLRYYQKDGRIGVEYDVYGTDRDDEEDLCGLIRFCDDIESLFKGDIGLVPLDVQTRGETDVRAYAEEMCRRHHYRQVAQARERCTASNLRTDNANRRIETGYNGTVLHGRIKRNGQPGRFTVKLSKPFALKKLHIFNYSNTEALSSNSDIFDWMTGELKDEILQEAKHALIRLFNIGLAKGRRPKADQ